MGTVGGERERAALSAEEDRSDQRQVRQMRAAGKRIVDRGDVAWAKLEPFDRGAHGKRSGAEMDRDMGGLRDQFAAAVEQRTREIVALLDVRREAGLAQHDAHLLGDRGEAVVHHRQRHWVELHR